MWSLRPNLFNTSLPFPSEQTRKRQLQLRRPRAQQTATASQAKPSGATVALRPYQWILSSCSSHTHGKPIQNLPSMLSGCSSNYNRLCFQDTAKSLPESRNYRNPFLSHEAIWPVAERESTSWDLQTPASQQLWVCVCVCSGRLGVPPGPQVGCQEEDCTVWPREGDRAGSPRGKEKNKSKVVGFQSKQQLYLNIS